MPLGLWEEKIFLYISGEWKLAYFGITTTASTKENRQCLMSVSSEPGIVPSLLFEVYDTQVR